MTEIDISAGPQRGEDFLLALPHRPPIGVGGNSGDPKCIALVQLRPRDLTQPDSYLVAHHISRPDRIVDPNTFTLNMARSHTSTGSLVGSRAQPHGQQMEFRWTSAWRSAHAAILGRRRGSGIHPGRPCLLVAVPDGAALRDLGPLPCYHHG
ncbi:hypothetical protein, partial [Frankia sp. CiP1_Cm_nod2]|uniref:hypothetical protein n=1 Tax=Frankia sp. CiP1_Cm_nod2 TaxID=2897161 RepID=UPI00202462D1